MPQSSDQLPFTRQDIIVLLRGRHSSRVRKRLRAMEALTCEPSIATASAKAGASRAATRAWLKRAKRYGLQALLQERAPPSAVTPRQRKDLRSQIARALRRPIAKYLRARLRGVDALLAGKSIATAVNISQHKQNTILSYKQRALRDGLHAILPRRFREPSLPPTVTVADLKRALNAEPRPAIRTRLQALIDYAQPTPGKPIHPRTNRWLRILNTRGLPALLHDPRGKRKPLTAAAIRRIRAKIAAVLARTSNWRLQLRLKALDAAFAGLPSGQAAALANFQPSTLNYWLGRIRTRGIDAVLADWDRRAPNQTTAFNANPAKFFKLAEQYGHSPKIRKRMLALAHVASGMSIPDVELRVRVGADAIRRYIQTYNTQGLAPLLVRAKKRRPEKPPPPANVALPPK